MLFKMPCTFHQTRIIFCLPRSQQRCSAVFLDLNKRQLLLCGLIKTVVRRFGNEVNQSSEKLLAVARERMHFSLNLGKVSFRTWHASITASAMQTKVVSYPYQEGWHAYMYLSPFVKWHDKIFRNQSCTTGADYRAGVASTAKY